MAVCLAVRVVFDGPAGSELIGSLPAGEPREAPGVSAIRDRRGRFPCIPMRDTLTQCFVTMNVLRSGLLSAAIGLAVPAPGLAADAPLTLSAALGIALENNPTLKVHAIGPRLAEARILQAGLRPNPELALEFENVLGTGQLSGVKGLETTLQLSQVIDLAGSRERRVDTAQAAAELAATDYERQRIDVFAEVARRFIEAAADTARLELANEAHQLAEQTLEAVQTRVEAAKASPLELLRARTALAMSEIEREHAEHELAVCRQSLAAMLGASEPNFGEVSADLLVLPPIEEFAGLARRVENSPRLARYGQEARWYEAQARLALSLRRSDLRVTGGVRRVETTDDWALVAGVSLPLMMRDQTQGTVREARALRDQTAAAAESARLELRATLFEVYQEMLHAETALAQLRGQVLPDAEQTLMLSQQAYREGRFSLLELIEAQQALIAFRRAVVANAAAYHLHVIEIERLLGAPLMPEPVQS